MNSMGDALIVIDPHFQIKKFNRAAEELLQYTGSDVLNQPIELVFEEIGQDLFSHEAIVEGKRMTFITKENKKIPVDVNVRPLLDIKGPLLGYVLVARDMRMTLELISRLENMNASLEETVKKRTGIIEKIYDELKMKDAQILQQEKMASIGVLAAGIAHEINNPVGYIHSNLEVLQENVRDIVSYVKGLEGVFPDQVQSDQQEQLIKTAQQMKEMRSKMRIEEVFHDMDGIIRESKQGIDRIKRIIVDLKKFSHTDENKMELADINQEIESTLNIVANELKYKAKVVKELGALPSIECFPHQLNQVFMNIMVNAAQAIEAQGSIFIQTSMKDDSIYIIIRDTGVGIRPENLQKIFDPFFTTKAVGKGTGLGLYIAYGIVEKHRGKISVQSEVGKGTTFTIQLPIHPSHVDAAAVPS
jgi:PAS domain S-box-containing protein